MSNVKVIRPTPVLKYFNTQTVSNHFQSGIPDGQIGSTSMLERLMLVIFARLAKAKVILEFGTYRGETSELFIVNKLCEKLISIDLPYFDQEAKQGADSLNLMVDTENDKFLSINRTSTVDERLQACAKNHDVELQLQKCDSLDFDQQEYTQRVDFIFIDGGHTTELIESDTKKALAMLTDNGIIAWHDYNSRIHGDVTNYLDKMSEQYTLYSVGDTSLVFYCKDSALMDQILTHQHLAAA